LNSQNFIGKGAISNIMTNNPKPDMSVQVIIATIGAVAVICAATIAIIPMVLPIILKPTPTMIPMPTIFPTQSSPETSAVPTDTPNPIFTSTITPTDTPTSTFEPTPTPTFTPTDTPTYTPTYTQTTPSLPDLTVVAISNPVCTRDHRFTPEKVYVKLTVTVRNLGSASTNSFGPFSVRVTLIFGQQRYSLDEWSSRFNGLINNPNLNVSNLDPNEDAQIDLSIDLKGHTAYSIEAIANSGANTIPESNTTNNVLTQSFSTDCK
jgi:hypothetical protein